MPFRIRRGTFGAAVFLLAVSGLIGGGTLWYSTHSQPTGSGANADPAAVAGVSSFLDVNFSQDEAANYAAAQGRIWIDLPQFDSYAGAQIVRSGIEVDLVGPPTDAILAMVAREDPQYQGKPIPVSYRSVRHSQRQLQPIADRIEADQGYWQPRGSDLSSVGFDPNSDTVQVTMVHYTKANRDALLARYGGSEWVSVVPHDVAAGHF
jgi:hypothetical protein